MQIIARYTIRYNPAEGWTELTEDGKSGYIAAQFGKPTPEALRYLFGKLAEVAQEKAKEV